MIIDHRIVDRRVIDQRMRRHTVDSGRPANARDRKAFASNICVGTASNLDTSGGGSRKSFVAGTVADYNYFKVAHANSAQQHSLPYSSMVTFEDYSTDSPFEEEADSSGYRLAV